MRTLKSIFILLSLTAPLKSMADSTYSFIDLRKFTAKKFKTCSQSIYSNKYGFYVGLEHEIRARFFNAPEKMYTFSTENKTLDIMSDDSFVYTLSPNKIEKRRLYDLKLLNHYYDEKQKNLSYDGKKYAFAKIDHYIAIAHGVKGFQIFNTHSQKFSDLKSPNLYIQHGLKSKFIDVVAYNGKFIFLVDKNTLNPFPHNNHGSSGFYIYEPYSQTGKHIHHYTEQGLDSLELIRNKLFITSFMPVLTYDAHLISEGFQHYPLYKNISLGGLGRLKKGKLFSDRYYTYACLENEKKHLFEIEIIDNTKVLYH